MKKATFRKSIFLSVILFFLGLTLNAEVNSFYAEQIGENNVRVSFTTDYWDCTVHWRKSGTSNWRSYHCNFGVGMLNVTNLNSGTWEFRITPGYSVYSDIPSATGIFINVAGLRYAPPPPPRHPPYHHRMDAPPHHHAAPPPSPHHHSAPPPKHHSAPSKHGNPPPAHSGNHPSRNSPPPRK